MGSWRFIAIAVAALVLVLVIGASHISILLVGPPLLAAGLVLFVAAMTVDYFGLSRRTDRWAGFDADPRRAWTRARALDLVFLRQRAAGSPRTASTARSLLLALAECDSLGDARGVVDFLGADAIYNRVGSDATSDALRAIALAELGRHGEASELCDALSANRRSRRMVVVAYARCRVAELDRRYSEALVEADRVIEAGHLRVGARRDVQLLRARVMVHLSRTEQATTLLLELVAQGYRHEVERIAELASERGQTAISMSARAALLDAAPYR